MQNIQNYAADIRATRETVMDLDMSDTSELEERLDNTIKDLRDRVQRQQAALETVLPFFPSTEKSARLHQLRVVKAAYEQLTPKEPDLPSPDSLLPTILALRTVQQTIAVTIHEITSTRQLLASAEGDLSRESGDLQENRLITASLERRIDHLREHQIAESNKPARQIANELVRSKQKRKLDFERETQRLHDALVEFIEQHLAAMVAAEDLGGPIVGSDLEIDEEALASGFTKGKTSTKPNSGDRQRRIDEIWATADPHHGGHPQSEKQVAGNDVHTLVERLIGALIGTSPTGVYVNLERDSAAARFLVRTKVAQFHPKDARRLRLVDFGRELDE
ncbi:hypothetical protein NA57DRAFT_67386 [Rhizodiscina lignyota]|uniref:Uncharacterized protein n=1 Tax=Rhizodiscina lignyota TaxID=1504668 RepID=A0A9P4ICJ9_9PEZI|nr:hypothetical protein NA57DRAFT_67386 [Rhizodiscina lignyota]